MHVATDFIPRDNWLAGVDADAPAPPPPPRPNPPPVGDFPLVSARSPSPAHGNYARWLTGSNTRDAGPEYQRPPVTAATSHPTYRAHHPPPPRSRSRPAASASNPRQPAPNHSNNWLDPAEAHRPARQPYIPDHFRTLEADSDSSSTTTGNESEYGIDIDDLLTDGETSDMPPITRRTQRHAQNSVVDLTNDPSSPPRPSTTRKRSRDDSTQDHASNKRSRRPSGESSSRAEPAAVEELDLTNEAPSAEEELLRTTQAAAIAAQQQSDPTNSTADAPLRVGQRTCIICMEPYTNATITACGHIYCHECLTQALIAGEKNSERGVGNCPVCRKPVSRKKEKQMVPVNFMKREMFKGKKRRAAGA